MPRLLATLSLALPLLAQSPLLRADDPLDDYLSLDLQDLLSLEVTSVARKKQRLTDSAAAIFVITNEDIRRSGVTSIPEVLRLAPGIQVARIDSNKWAISSRGFNGQFANKLLVLIDGRSVYTPTYAGVYWEVQDVLLEDIDRIEVVRGPGATIWGANAVNGVINIITRSAEKSQGTLVSIGAGDEEKTVAVLRRGFAFGDGGFGRVYAKFNQRDSSYSPDLGGEAGDDWEKVQAGFRMDLALSSRDSLILQGDYYRADENQTLRQFILDPLDPANQPPDPQHPYVIPFVEDAFESSGYNLMMRWNREGGEVTTNLQVYADHTERDEKVAYLQVNTLDIDFSQNWTLSPRNELLWGFGYRYIDDSFGNTFRTIFYEDPEYPSLYNLFVQDEYAINDRLHFTAGIKWEHNEITGMETQPSLRLLWTPDETQTWWGAVSRAVHTPVRLGTASSIVAYLLPPDPVDPNYPLPQVLRLDGNPELESEAVDAFEIGYRLRPDEKLSLDLALFHNRYDRLITYEVLSRQSFQVPSPYFPGEWIYLPTEMTYGNKRSATSQGLELSLDWQVRENWRLKFNYSWLDIDAKRDADGTDMLGDSVLEGSAPDYQWSLRSQHNIRPDLSMDLWIYHVDELPFAGYSRPRPIPAYTSFNLRLAWRRGDMEFSVAGFNLLHDRHAEFASENILVLTEVERSLLATLRWGF